MTAATANAEWRDHLNFLKGALDTLTGSTTADTGDTMSVKISRSTSSSDALAAGVTSDAISRFIVRSDGRLEWGTGAVARDAMIGRVAANVLRTTDTALSAARGATTSSALQTLVTSDTNVRFNVQADGGMAWSDGTNTADVTLFRAAADFLRTNDAMSSMRAASSDMAFQAVVTGDSIGRLTIQASGQMDWGSGAGAADVSLSRSAANVLSLASGDVLAVNGTQVVTARQTGWVVATGTASRATYATSTVTLATLAGVVMALEQDLITHGIIGT